MPSRTRRSGQAVRIRGVEIWRCSGGKIVEHWGAVDVRRPRQIGLSARNILPERRLASRPGQRDTGAAVHALDLWFKSGRSIGRVRVVVSHR